MKRIFTLIAALMLFSGAYAQAPEKMSYQAVIRNSSNTLVANQPIEMQISILQGSPTGSAVYVENQTPVTNSNGLVSIEIGAGTKVSGEFTAIDWATGPFFIKTVSNVPGTQTKGPKGTTSSGGTVTGTSQLMSVPYAMYAKTSGSSLPGPAGPQGEQGIAGPTGPVGPAGAVGPTGEQGIAGPQGPAGRDGATGPAGPQGEQGLIGPKGDQGVAGAQGEQGIAGPTGPTGAKGEQGEQGVAGPTGPVGPAGAVGPTGEQGIAGPQGPAGRDGATGPAGPQGEQGPQGEKGLDAGTRTAFLRDQRQSAQHGGSAVLNQWNTRALNILEGDNSFVELSNNRFILQPGKYTIEIMAPAYATAAHQAKLKDINTGADVLIGTTGFSHPSAPAISHSFIQGILTVSTPTTYEVQHRAGVERLFSGLGQAANFGTVEIYTQIKIMKVE
ncbi:collagen-like protein [Pontibacter akesuensis]|uniref:collagen-like protein n=1 Tax=Pontibacter akesuensis TaxID=388950 RepID=UPI0021CFC92D|nr:collagen-like protein [Pontibacter akesuensis]